ncbi:TRAP transporter permease [Oceanidesulfovibrio marinus]|uniref:TRAP transporter permease n=1 Tax=Oceanidesulfovibrio marinus TaxID=370038 RepID=A0ABX6NBD3_9BACT|nr:TRAP transporter permease [Oceanidesulfovibrio marinus]QJT07897.1 TRAP transporter permease [Oceanidesulfovibrio marinus]
MTDSQTVPAGAHGGTEQDIDSETLAIKRVLAGRTARIVYVVGILCSLFHLWVNTVGIMPEIQRNAVHYAFILFLGFLQYPLLKRKADKSIAIDYGLAILAFAVGFYLVFFEDALHARNEVPNMVDLIAAGLAIILMLEVTRRTTGLLIPALCVIALSYSLFLGRAFGGLWHFPGVTIERILYRMYFAPDGLFGTIATISSTFVFLFVLFAAFLIKSGAGEFIIDLAMAVMGRLTGGPAKMAVFASGIMGSISGSAVANTVGTGSITIPMMKRMGFKPQFAGGIEAAASTGGQLMPPIMGAGAFIMSQWTQIPYLTIVGVAFIPAIMYFVSVAFFIHLRAKRRGLEPLSSDEIPKVREVLKRGWNFFIPIGVLIGLLMLRYTPTFAACGGIASIVVASWLNPRTRMSFRDIMDALSMGAQNMVTTGIILLCSGIIIGVVLMVGMGIKFSMLIQSISQGSLMLTIILVALASLILGMGLPVTASYIVLAVLAAPAMTMLGTSTIAAHMLIFWYSQDANVTPPVCLAAYSAAGIAGAKPLATGFESWKLAKALYIIPLLFCYSPLLFEGPTWQVVETAVLGLGGLFCFAVFFEGYNQRMLSWPARVFYLGCAAAMLWPDLRLHALGAAAFIAGSVMEVTVFRPGRSAAVVAVQKE